MQQELADLVMPVIEYGLQLRERLAAGEDLSLAGEQAVLKGLLLSDAEARRWLDFGGEAAAETASGDSTAAGSQRFLGVRYALVCWLDECFILDSPWERAWNEHKLEAALYGANDRAWRFWEQARLAEARPGADALEVFFWCVMLGFRGSLREEPRRLEEWIDATRGRITKSLAQPWSAPPELEPPINVPPLHGRDRLRRMVFTAAAVLLLLIPILAFLLVARLG